MSDIIKVPAVSTEYLNVAYIPTDGQGITGQSPQFAATSSESVEPDDTAWLDGFWGATQIFTSINDKYRKCYVAKIKFSLPGDGGDIELAKGDHFLWFKRITTDEEVVRPLGIVRVY